MSIPLDRLYNYLNDISNRDIIIYRWFPHGSKKIEDLTIIQFDNQQKSIAASPEWMRLMMTPSMICHDQEPLDYNSYLPDTLEDYFCQKFTESPCYRSPQYKELIKGMNLRAAILMPLSVYDKVLLCHSEKNSKELQTYESNGFIGVYYWAHAVIAKDWFRYAEHDPLLVNNVEEVQCDFLIYNRAWSGSREYRLKFVEMLHEYDLLDSCKTSFSEFDNDIHYTQHQYKNSKFIVTNTRLEHLLPKNTTTSNYSADYDHLDYKTAGIEVVLETLFDDTRNHLTEKSLRAIACGKPFLLVATPGSLQYLRSYGFKTFADYINESYDEIIDPLERLTAVVQEMKRIAILSDSDKKILWKKLNEIAEYNKQLFFSKDWEDSVINEYTRNLEDALSKLDNCCTGKIWTTLFAPETADDIIRNVPIRNNGQQINDWIKQRSQG